MSSQIPRTGSPQRRVASETARHPGRPVRLLVAAVLALVLMAGCAFTGGYEGVTPPPRYAELEESFTDAEPAPAEAPAGQAPASRSSGSQAPATEPERPHEERMRVYSGSLELSVARVEQARAAIIAYADTVGGYVERSTADSVIVRVPAARFDEAMNRIAEEGDVRARSVETSDVTDQYADLERRLEIASASRERLYELLERTDAEDDAGERVAILREIRRLSEEIERLQSSLDSLAELVAYSRISVRLLARIQANQVMRDRIPFPWIARLDPLSGTLGEAGVDLDLVVPHSFAAFETGTRIRAERADGTRLRVGARSNEPVGDASFWAAALAYHLGPFYRTAEPVSYGRAGSGGFEGIIFESRDAEPFSYLVLVSVRGSELLVFEVFFPDAAAREGALPEIVEMIGGGIQ